jgi:hypothetical protein
MLLNETFWSCLAFFVLVILWSKIEIKINY